MLPRQLVDPIGPDHQQGLVRQVRGEGAQQFDAGGIGPVQILQHQQHWTGLGEAEEDLAHLREEGRLVDDRSLEDPAGERRRNGERRLFRAQIAEQIEPGTIGRGVGEVIAVAGKDEDAALRGFGGQIVGQRGLADARLAADEDEAATGRQWRSPVPRAGRRARCRVRQVVRLVLENELRRPAVAPQPNLVPDITSIDDVADRRGESARCAENHRRTLCYYRLAAVGIRDEEWWERYGVSERGPVTGS